MAHVDVPYAQARDAHRHSRAPQDTLSLTIPRTSLRLCISLGADLSRNTEGRLPRRDSKEEEEEEDLTTCAPSWPWGAR